MLNSFNRGTEKISSDMVTLVHMNRNKSVDLLTKKNPIIQRTFMRYLLSYKEQVYFLYLSVGKEMSFLHNNKVY